MANKAVQRAPSPGAADLGSLGHRMYRQILFALFMGFLIAACGPDRVHHDGLYSQLRMGMTRTEVMKLANSVGGTIKHETTDIMKDWAAKKQHKSGDSVFYDYFYFSNTTLSDVVSIGYDETERVTFFHTTGAQPRASADAGTHRPRR